jgi:uncharacterized membrane protein
MKQDEEKDITRDEIKKEFQLERMILFSDAVFAIVITLMAMEIKLPQSAEGLTDALLPKALFHLLPVILAYTASFIVIGAVWYQHLKMFSLLKDYDKGLVVRNLTLLFFIGLFPFTASVITSAKGSSIAFYLYFGIIFLTIVCQYILYHYILVKRPALRFNADLNYHHEELHKRKISLILFSSSAVLIAITHFLISDPELKPLATLWMAVFPIVYKSLTKKKKSK